jgi:hypothetical protein
MGWCQALLLVLLDEVGDAGDVDTWNNGLSFDGTAV